MYCHNHYFVSEIPNAFGDGAILISRCSALYCFVCVHILLYICQPNWFCTNTWHYWYSLSKAYCPFCYHWSHIQCNYMSYVELLSVKKLCSLNLHRVSKLTYYEICLFFFTRLYEWITCVYHSKSKLQIWNSSCKHLPFLREANICWRKKIHDNLAFQKQE